MTISLPRPDSQSPAGEASCPNCSTALQREGESSQAYWTCRNCNLVFLA